MIKIGFRIFFKTAISRISSRGVTRAEVLMARSELEFVIRPC